MNMRPEGEGPALRGSPGAVTRASCWGKRWPLRKTGWGWLLRGSSWSKWGTGWWGRGREKGRS